MSPDLIWKETPVSKWIDFVQLAVSLSGERWHFRGVLEKWRLKTSIERAAEDWKIHPKKLPNLEKQLIFEFKRACHLSARMQLPNPDDTLGWLALMQHHGTPTRLLDLTYSPFVAAYFALDALLSSPEPRPNAAVYALKITPFERPEDALPTQELKVAYEQYQQTRGGGPFRKIFLDANPPVTHAFLVNPYLLTERLAVQQGLFVIPGNVALPFEDNLSIMPDASNTQNLQKFILQPSVLSDGLQGLRRMNIHSASLFPGLDGFARGLRHSCEFLISPQKFQGTGYY